MFAAALTWFVIGVGFAAGAVVALVAVVKAPAAAFAASLIGVVTLHQAGSAVIAVGAVSAALVATAAFLRLGPVRRVFGALWRRNVTQPVDEAATRWATRMLAEVHHRLERIETHLGIGPHTNLD